MPLKEGCSIESSKHNYKTLLNDGYPKHQAYKIALTIALQNKNLCDMSRQQAINKGQLFNKKYI